jgi:hypothetical protein
MEFSKTNEKIQFSSGLKDKDLKTANLLLLKKI